jgi:hypothetical protein
MTHHRDYLSCAPNTEPNSKQRWACQEIDGGQWGVGHYPAHSCCCVVCLAMPAICARPVVRARPVLANGMQASNMEYVPTHFRQACFMFLPALSPVALS